MNKIIKYAGLFAILPLFVVALTTDYIGEADAATAKGSPGAQPSKFYGKATENIVCGGALCSDASLNATPVVLPETPDIRE